MTDLTPKKRVLIVGPVKPANGGIVTYIDELLASDELRQHFLLKVLDPLMIKGRHRKQESRINFTELLAGLKVIVSFIAMIREYNPHLVHIHSSSYWGFYEKALLLFISKYGLKRKTILHLHGGEFGLFYGRSSLKWLINFVIRSADRALIVSKEFKEQIGNNKLIVVDNAVPFGKEYLYKEKRNLREKYAINSGKTVFYSLALFEKRKGLLDSLKVFKNIIRGRSDFVYIIAGEGPEKEEMKRYIQQEKLENSVLLMDAVRGKQKEELFLLSDVYILNSSSESFAITLIEAVSYGLFIITTKVGIASNVESIFHDGNCIRIEIGDSKGLEDAILAVLNKEVDIPKIARMNFVDFQARFASENVYRKLRTIYEEVLN